MPKHPTCSFHENENTTSGARNKIKAASQCVMCPLICGPLPCLAPLHHTELIRRKPHLQRELAAERSCRQQHRDGYQQRCHTQWQLHHPCSYTHYNPALSCFHKLIHRPSCVSSWACECPRNCTSGSCEPSTCSDTATLLVFRLHSCFTSICDCDCYCGGCWVTGVGSFLRPALAWSIRENSSKQQQQENDFTPKVCPCDLFELLNVCTFGSLQECWCSSAQRLDLLLDYAQLF